MFPCNTKVETDSGTRPISEIHTGDRVMAWNGSRVCAMPVTGTVMARLETRVLRVSRTPGYSAQPEFWFWFTTRLVAGNGQEFLAFLQTGDGGADPWRPLPTLYGGTVWCVAEPEPGPVRPLYGLLLHDPEAAYPVAAPFLGLFARQNLAREMKQVVRDFKAWEQRHGR